MYFDMASASLREGGWDLMIVFHDQDGDASLFTPNNGRNDDHNL
jgi:hypothetical protein